MEIATLCFLVKEDSVLLGKKKRNIGGGKWNGFGGKVEIRETIVKAAAREVEGETSIKVAPGSLIKVGVVTCFFENIPAWEIHLFFANKWKGIPKETAEMGSYKWFPFKQLPFEEMLPSDQKWMPLIFQGKKISAEVYYNEDATELKEFKWKEEGF